MLYYSYIISAYEADDLRMGANSVNYLRSIGLLPDAEAPSRRFRGHVRGLAGVRLQRVALQYLAAWVQTFSVVFPSALIAAFPLPR